MTTTMKYIDFTQKALEKNFWGTYTYDNLDAVLERANEWIRKNYNCEIINVETVVLPNIYKKGIATTNQLSQFITGGSTVINFQIIRIWYKG